MSIELKYLTWVVVFTAIMWIPYILNMILVRGLIDAVGYQENPKPLAAWARSPRPPVPSTSGRGWRIS